jgi:aldehyde:ferredoxin oxidoreductase
VISWANDLDILPTRNFQIGVYENAHKISGEPFEQKYSVKKGGQPGKACFACPAECSRMSRVNVPGLEGAGEGPEYESLASLCLRLITPGGD